MALCHRGVLQGANEILAVGCSAQREQSNESKAAEASVCVALRRCQSALVPAVWFRPCVSPGT